MLWKASINIPSASGLLHTRRGNNSKYLQLKSCLDYCIQPNLKQSNLMLYCFHKTEKFEKLKLVADNSRATTVPSPWLLKSALSSNWSALNFLTPRCSNLMDFPSETILWQYSQVIQGLFRPLGVWPDCEELSTYSFRGWEVGCEMQSRSPFLQIPDLLPVVTNA